MITSHRHHYWVVVRMVHSIAIFAQGSGSLTGDCFVLSQMACSLIFNILFEYLLCLEPSCVAC